MNVGVIILALMLAGGAVLVMIMGAAAQPVDYTDTFGNTHTAATNNTQGIIVNGTAPAAGFGGGAVLLLAAITVFVAAMGAWYAIQRHGGNRYSGRHG